MEKILRVGHSPDPDDAFMFYGITQNYVDIDGYKIEHVIEDIQSLNQRALKAELEVTAVSAAMYPFIADKYWILNCGASVGRNYGPIIVANQPMTEAQLKGKKIAVPGLQTTAYLLLKIFLKDFEPVVISFEKIIEAVKAGKVDAGLVIHEGQLNFSDYGVHNCMDLGKMWFDKYKLPIPLGLDLVRRDLGMEMAKKLNAALVKSIRYAMDDERSIDYALKFGRGIPRDTAKKFVGMYVNEDTLDLGEEGRKALELLFKDGAAAGVFKPLPSFEVITN